METRTRETWQGAFGMLEMEHAAEVMLAKSVLLGKPLVEVDFYPHDFIDTDVFNRCSLKGFVELIGRGWLAKPARYVYNGGFGVTDGFLDRLKERGIAYQE